MAREHGRGTHASDLRCGVRSDRGEVIRPRPIGAYSVTRNEDVFIAELGFKAPRSGSYRVACEPRGPLPLAVSRRIYLWRLFALGFAALALCAGTIMLGVRIARRARMNSRSGISHPSEKSSGGRKHRKKKPGSSSIRGNCRHSVDRGVRRRSNREAHRLHAGSRSHVVHSSRGQHQFWSSSIRVLGGVACGRLG